MKKFFILFFILILVGGITFAQSDVSDHKPGLIHTTTGVNWYPTIDAA